MDALKEDIVHRLPEFDVIVACNSLGCGYFLGDCLAIATGSQSAGLSKFNTAGCANDFLSASNIAGS